MPFSFLHNLLNSKPGVTNVKAPLKDNCFCGYHLVVTRVECMDALMKWFERTSNGS